MYPKAVDKFPNPSPVVRNLGTCLLFHGLGPVNRSFFSRAREEGKEKPQSASGAIEEWNGPKIRNQKRPFHWFRNSTKGVSYEDMKVEFL